MRVACSLIISQWRARCDPKIQIHEKFPTRRTSENIWDWIESFFAFHAIIIDWSIQCYILYGNYTPTDGVWSTVCTLYCIVESLLGEYGVIMAYRWSPCIGPHKNYFAICAGIFFMGECSQRGILIKVFSCDWIFCKWRIRKHLFYEGVHRQCKLHWYALRNAGV